MVESQAAQSLFSEQSLKWIWNCWTKECWFSCNPERSPWPLSIRIRNQCVIHISCVWIEKLHSVGYASWNCAVVVHVLVNWADTLHVNSSWILQILCHVANRRNLRKLKNNLWMNNLKISTTIFNFSPLGYLNSHIEYNPAPQSHW